MKVDSSAWPRFENQNVMQFIHDCLLILKVKEEDAWLAAKHLSHTQRREVFSHGIGLLPLYLTMLAKSKFKNQPNDKYHINCPTMATMDCDFGLGIVSVIKALTKAKLLARRHGTATIFGVKATHIGAAGFIAYDGAESGFITQVCCNTELFVNWPNTSTAIMGSNAFSIGLPCSDQGEERHLVFDGATCGYAFNYIRVMEDSCQPLPDHMVISRVGGESITDPTAALNQLMQGNAVITAIGHEKDYGPKGAMLGVFSGLMSSMGGAHFGPRTPGLQLPNPENAVVSNGSGFSITLTDPTAIPSFNDEGELPRTKSSAFSVFNTRILEWQKSVETATPTNGETPRWPGQRSALALKRNLNSMPIVPSLVERLNAWAEQNGLDQRLVPI